MWKNSYYSHPINSFLPQHKSMASDQSYTEALKESAIQQVVADLIKEKQEENNVNKKARGDSYALKLAYLA